jgi:hypothetical protein
MLWKFLIAFVLVAITVVVHVVGLALLLKAVIKTQPGIPTRFWPIIGLLVHLTWWLILIHLIEISVWGMFYYSKGCLPDAESSFYFSGVTYATIGYGDVVLSKPWQLFGPVEGLTGILMCGLSASIFFAVISRIYTACAEAKQK